MTSFSSIAKPLFLAGVLLLSGCEMIFDTKGKDGASVGYACRMSKKLPEQCMQENSSFSPTSILEGWKVADKDIKEGKVDTKFQNPAPAIKKDEAAPKSEGAAPAEAAPPAEGAKPPGEGAKPAEEAAKH